MPASGHERIRVDAHPLGQREHLQQREALAVRRDDAYVEVSVPTAQRRNDVRSVRGHVVDREMALPSPGGPRRIARRGNRRTGWAALRSRVPGASRRAPAAGTGRRAGAGRHRGRTRRPCRGRRPRASGVPSARARATGRRRRLRARARFAGPNASAHGSVAPSACRAAHPLTAPGTVIESGPCSGMAPPCRSRSPWASTPAGARPLALIATVEPSGRCTNANRSPPTPQLCG